MNHGFSINVEDPSWERKVRRLFDRQEELTMQEPNTFSTGEQVCCFTYLGFNKSRSCIDASLKDSAEKVQFMPEIKVQRKRTLCQILMMGNPDHVLMKGKLKGFCRESTV